MAPSWILWFIGVGFFAAGAYSWAMGFWVISLICSIVTAIAVFSGWID